MKTSDRGVAFIKRFEGFSATPYICKGGKLTIGYGHIANVTPEMRVTEAEAIERLRDDLKEAERAVSRYITRRLTQNQYDALVAFAFNVGSGNFAQSTLRHKVNAMDDAAAEAEFKKWVYARGKKLKGLENRREQEADMFMELPWLE